MSIYDAYLRGELDVAIRLGVVRFSIVEYCRIYEQFRKEREEGRTYVEAVEIISERMCVSEATVRRAVAIVI